MNVEGFFAVGVVHKIRYRYIEGNMGALVLFIHSLAIPFRGEFSSIPRAIL